MKKTKKYQKGGFLYKNTKRKQIYSYSKSSRSKPSSRTRIYSYSRRPSVKSSKSTF